ncbi:hypothetical protein AmDm5_0874 [Acetobacter malorum]|nr:hypothetical protein AmDm5_0874 [Acetobacter malorum]
MGDLQVLHDDLDDFAYSTFHGFWACGFSIPLSLPFSLYN